MMDDFIIFLYFINKNADYFAANPVNYSMVYTH